MVLDCIHSTQIALTIVFLLVKIWILNLRLLIILRSIKMNQSEIIHAPIEKNYILSNIFVFEPTQEEK